MSRKIITSLMVILLFLQISSGTPEKPQPVDIKELKELSKETKNDHPISIGNDPIPKRSRPTTAIEQIIKNKIPDITPGGGDFGNFILNSPGVMGVMAQQQVYPNLNLNPTGSPTLYAPTLMAPNYSSLESVTAYWRYSGMNHTARAWGVWNHSKGGWAILKKMDDNFLNNYVKTFPEGDFYFTEIIKYGDYWYVLLYNFQTNSWNLFYTSKSVSKYSKGWSVFESYFAGYCQTLPDITSRENKIFVNGNWSNVTKTKGSLIDYTPCPYTKKITPYTSWTVRKPPSNVINVYYPNGKYNPYIIELKTSISVPIRVKFYDNNVFYRLETSPKYCMFGGDVKCYTGKLKIGKHTIVARIYSARTGSLLATVSSIITQV